MHGRKIYVKDWKRCLIVCYLKYKRSFYISFLASSSWSIRFRKSLIHTGEKIVLSRQKKKKNDLRLKELLKIKMEEILLKIDRDKFDNYHERLEPVVSSLSKHKYAGPVFEVIDPSTIETRQTYRKAYDVLFVLPPSPPPRELLLPSCIRVAKRLSVCSSIVSLSSNDASINFRNP